MASIAAKTFQQRVRDLFLSVLTDLGWIRTRFRSQLFNSGALAIKTASSAIVKAGAAFYAVVDGVIVTKAQNTDMAALAGTVTNGKFNVYCFFIDSAGALTSAMGTAGDTLAGVVFPAVPSGKAMIGFVIINPDGTGDFVGGTTALDDGTVSPNAVYVNTVGVQDPSTALDLTA